PPPPPLPPLLPYTTLFRSQPSCPGRRFAPGRGVRRQGADGGVFREGGAPRGTGAEIHHRLRARVAGSAGQHRTTGSPHLSGALRDRKSTRLNSSHVSISYA